MLTLIALADLALLFHLRRRRTRKMRLEQMTASLSLAIRRANQNEAMSSARQGRGSGDRSLRVAPQIGS